jgi:hypothetical protein
MDDLHLRKNNTKSKISNYLNLDDIKASSSSCVESSRGNGIIAI